MNSCVPLSLAKEIKLGRCVLFLGAGASMESKAPSSQKLATELADTHLAGYHRHDPLERVAAYIEHQPGLGRQVVLKHISDRLAGLTPSDAHLELPRWPWAAIYTTNYDLLVEDAYYSIDTYTLGKILKSTDITMLAEEHEINLSRIKLPYFKLHGCISNAHSKENPLVVSEDDYFRTMENKKALYRFLESYKYKHTFLFIGYSFQDMYLNQLWREIQNELGELSNWAYALWPRHSDAQYNLWRDRGVELINCSFNHFIEQLEHEAESDRDLAQRLGMEQLPSVVQVLLRVLILKHPNYIEDVQRISTLAMAVGQRLDLDDDQMSNIDLAVLLSGLGDVGISDTIHYKPAALTHEDWEIMKTRPRLADFILEDIEGFSGVRNILRGLHERPDGQGYPDGLQGNDIPIGAQVLSVVDAFNAMTTERSYREAFSLHEALSELQEQAAVEALNADVVDALVNVAHENEGWIKSIMG